MNLKSHNFHIFQRKQVNFLTCCKRFQFENNRTKIGLKGMEVMSLKSFIGGIHPKDQNNIQRIYLLLK